MTIPESLRSVLIALARRGRPYLVGGCVRDWLLGIQPKDFDVEVFGLGWEDLSAALAPFGPTDVVGKSFGVMKVRVGDSEYDVGLPRRETKAGSGHRGFEVVPDPNLDETAASARRDFTINAILYDPIHARVVDRHGGRSDLANRILRHTSAAFVEDPLRVLRGFQLAARFDLTLDPATAALCSSIGGTFAELPRERVWGEWDKWATKAVRPSRGLVVLRETGWLRHFPELAALDGLPQEPDWHPEGDVLTHTGHCLDALVGLPDWVNASADGRRILSFAVLGHDLGKATTTQRADRHGRERWISPGHDRAGGPLAEQFLERLGSPVEPRAWVRALVEHHHAHQSWPAGGPADPTIRRLARRIAPATLNQLAAVMEADHRGRPPVVSAETQRQIEALREGAHRLELAGHAPRPILKGRDLIALGLEPGPRFSRILRVAFEAQLDGDFADHESGAIWLRRYLDGKAESPAAEPPEAGHG